MSGILDAVELHWPDCRNARDLGGLPTADGGRIRDGALIRSDHHERLTPAAVAEIRASGVRRILDLRWDWERERHPSPFAADPIYRHVPLLAETLDYEIIPDTYGPMLDHNRERIRIAFTALADAPPGGVVVHCHGGRDRTGGLVALALAVAGVRDETITEDYALTTTAEPVAMVNTLRHVRARYGSAVEYLVTAGVAGDRIEAVRNRLLSS